MVRMRSPVRIWLSAPSIPVNFAFAGIFAVRIFEGNGEKWAKMRCVMHRLCTNGKQGQDVLSCKTLSVVHLASLQINHSFYLTDFNKRHKADPFIPSPPPLHPSQSTPPWAPREPSRDSENAFFLQPGQHPTLDTLAVALGIQIIPEPANLPPPGGHGPRSIKACKTACFFSVPVSSPAFWDFTSFASSWYSSAVMPEKRPAAASYCACSVSFIWLRR